MGSSYGMAMWCQEQGRRMTDLVAGMVSLPQLRLAAGKTILGHLNAVHTSLTDLWEHGQTDLLTQATPQFLSSKLYSPQSAM